MDYEIDGTPKERPALHPVGLGATIAAASLTSESDSRENWVRLFWDTPLRTDARRYFDSDLCFFTLLLLSGHYRIW
jgi:oligosaccharide reducing-end xylanase